MTSATRLFVGNLPENTNENDLQSAFSAFGEIQNLDLKSKSGGANENKKFAFVSISASNQNVESCIRHFSNEVFNGNILYVTKARESFLERLQREREQTQKKDIEKVEHQLPKHNPVINLGDKLNPKRRKFDYNNSNDNYNANKHNKEHKNNNINNFPAGDAAKTDKTPITEAEKKKNESDKKRMESMKKKRQDFKQKQMIIKTGLTGVDKVQNKKVIFSDDEENFPKKYIENSKNQQQLTDKSTLFDDDDGDENDVELNFDIKKQFEGRQGQKVLDLQSRYKSDKRFTLDERFIEDEKEDDQRDEEIRENYNETEIDPVDERAKQLSILQDVLGVAIRTRGPDQDNRKTKQKIGMLRFDPMQPDHAKFLAPVEEIKQVPTKKSKNKAKEKIEEDKAELPKQEGPTVEVSKEQFYKVSETLKEAIVQPTTFSLRSLFGNNDEANEPQEQDSGFIPLEAPKEKKVKNPFEPREKNPFVYDSSDSEDEQVEKEIKTDLPSVEPKAVWKENLFFATSDQRLKEGLAFFSKSPENEGQKERRELKTLMKKRIYNKDRQNQMFKKKIGGKKKSMKKPYKNKR